jgi:predicted phage terminase large subunit-like protein
VTQNNLLTRADLKTLIQMRAYQDFEFFSRFFFEHHCSCPFSPMHLDFCGLEKDPSKRGRREAIAAPRGHAKTTVKMLFKALHAIVYGYEPFILVIGHSASESEQKVRDILEELENNERLIAIYGNLAPKQGQYSGVAHWGKRKFISQNGVMVMSRSKGQQVRGLKHGPHRPSLIICDDVESLEGVLTPEQRNKTRDWFFKDVMKSGQLGGKTNIILIGTCLHPESLLSELLVAPGWESAKYQAVISFAQNKPLWDEWRQLYTNLADPLRANRAADFLMDHQEEMLTGTSVLWPQGDPYELLMRQQVDEGLASFYSEKQNEPFDPTRQLFNMNMLKRFRLLFEGKEFRQIHCLDGPERKIPRSHIERIVAFHDPALGKKPHQHSEPDYAAIVVVGKDTYGYLYCLDAYIEKDPPTLQIQKAFELHRKWGFETLYLEDNHFQALLKQSYDDANQQQPEHRLRVVGVHQHQNKYQRISTLEPLISNGHLLFADTLNPRLLSQLTLFPTEYDDGPDALQGAVAQLKELNSIEMMRRFYAGA